MTRTCGRPTKQGTPCTRVLQPWETACSSHATPAEQEAEYQTLKAQQAARRKEAEAARRALYPERYAEAGWGIRRRSAQSDGSEG